MRADLALVGFGHVGRRFVRLLVELQDRLQACDLEPRIVAIATRRHGVAYRASGLDALRAAELVEAGGTLGAVHASSSGPAPADALAAIARLGSSDSALRVLVETTTLNITDGQPAVSHVRAALDSGVHVVTANKGPTAFACHALDARAREQGVSFLFEGAVMDGVPIFNLVRETMPGVEILGFRGVVNSTTNHILTALEDGDEFAPALEKMQEAGIAEADPSLDIDGWDAAAKAAALANVWFDARVTPHDVERRGIGPDTGGMARAARARHSRLRLVASARRGERPRVGLVELPESDLLAGLRGTANALVIESDVLGALAIHQLEGSLTQTAYALLSDLVTIRRRERARI